MEDLTDQDLEVTDSEDENNEQNTTLYDELYEESEEITIPTPDQDEYILWTDSANIQCVTSTVTRTSSGPSAIARSVNNESDSFKFFITDEISQIIIKWTNQRIDRIIQSLRERATRVNIGFKIESYMHQITESELHAFYGLLVTMAMKQDNMISLKELWSEDVEFSTPIYDGAMSRNRFEWINRAMRFDDMDTRQQRKNNDKLAAIREIIELFRERCRTGYNCTGYWTIDERIVPCKGRCPFRVYMPNKPDSYGILLYVLASAEERYIKDFIVYLGKEIEVVDGELHSVVTKDLGMKVVLELMSKPPRGQHVTTDNFFTSYKLAQKLLENDHTITGTIRLNRKEIPVSMKLHPDPNYPRAKRQLYDSKFLFTKSTSLCSYIAKENKCVCVLST